MSTFFKYFNRTKAEGSNLPNPSGPLSEKVPATSIEEANKEVELSRNSNGGKRRREPYVIVTPEQKASTLQKMVQPMPYVVFPRICQI